MSLRSFYKSFNQSFCCVEIFMRVIFATEALQLRNLFFLFYIIYKISTLFDLIKNPQLQTLDDFKIMSEGKSIVSKFTFSKKNLRLIFTWLMMYIAELSLTLSSSHILKMFLLSMNIKRFHLIYEEVNGGKMFWGCNNFF